MILRVWAPRPDRVELLIHSARHAAEPAGGGWWAIEVPSAAPGDDYAWSLDGGPPRPDPRSRDQPEGVHGPSRLVDPSAYRWRHPDWRAPALSSGVIMELHVGTFTPEGTLDAAASRLDHLVDLGVTHVELMPLNAFDGTFGWGYDGVLWAAPHRPYTGPDGPDAVRRFVDACHERGLAVLLDVVFNHLGPSGNHLPEFGPYFTDAHHTPWGDAINLDGPGSHEVRRLIVDVALEWLRDHRFDGLRIDAVHAFHDRSAVHLLEELRHAVDDLQARTGRPMVLVAESDLNDPRVITPAAAGGWGMDAQWSDDFHHALHARLTGERRGWHADLGRAADLAKAWRSAFVLDGGFSRHRDRHHGRPVPRGTRSDRFLAYAQTHDQVGNRARGERLCHLVPEPAAELAAALVLLSPFVPMLFQGEEWAASTPFRYVADHADPALAEAVRTGRRREFAAFVDDPADVPDPCDPATLRASVLDWSERSAPRHARALDWHRRLIRLRRERPELAPGRLGEDEVASAEDPPWLRVRRRGLLLAFSLGPRPADVPLGEDPPADVLLTNDPAAVVDAGHVRLGPYAMIVLGPSAD